MGKYYENLTHLVELIKKAEKKELIAEFILTCLIVAKENPNLSPHEIIKISKKQWNL